MCACELCVLTRVCVCLKEGERKEVDGTGLSFLYQWQGSLRLLTSVKADCGENLHINFKNSWPGRLSIFLIPNSI